MHITASPAIGMDNQLGWDWSDLLQASDTYFKSLGPHKHGCLMLLLPPDAAKQTTDWVIENVDDAHLAPEGRELRPHVTVAYGFDGDSEHVLEILKPLLARTGPIAVRLTGLSLFRGGKDGDVLHAEVESPQLTGLHHAIAGACPLPGEKYPTYKPHVTLAYLRPEASNLYEEEHPPFLGQVLDLTLAEYSSPDGEREQIPLSFLPALEFGEKAMSALNPLAGGALVQPPRQGKAGLAAGRPDSDFDPKQLARGQKIEMEHTDDPAEARRIAKDHLTEMPDYYTRLEAMEAEAKQEAQQSKLGHVREGMHVCPVCRQRYYTAAKATACCGEEGHRLRGKSISTSFQPGDVIHPRERLHASTNQFTRGGGALVEVFAESGEAVSVASVLANGMLIVRNAAGRECPQPPGKFREFKSLADHQAKSNDYFANCERDNEGHCTLKPGDQKTKPKKPKKLTVQKIGQELAGMGYKLEMGESVPHEGAWTTTYRITGPDGKTQTATARALTELVYGLSKSIKSTPDQVLAAVDRLGGGSLGQVSLQQLGQALGVTPAELHRLVNQLRREGKLTAAGAEGRSGSSADASRWWIDEGQGTHPIGFVERRRKWLSPFKSLPGYLTKDRGQPCKPGEAAARSGCIPTQNQPGQQPAAGQQQTQPQRQASEQQGAFAAASRVAKAVVDAGYGVPKEKLSALIKIIPDEVKAPVANVWHAVHGILMAGNHAAQALAREVARGKGLSNAEVEQLGSTLAAIDATFQGGAMVTAAGTAALAPAVALAAKAASYLPVASAGYILTSFGRHPVITSKAAWTLLRERFPGKIKGAAQFAWGSVQHPLTRHGEGHKSLTQHDSKANATLIADHLAKAEDRDWWLALFSAAFDEVRDVAEACQMADAAANPVSGRPGPSPYGKSFAGHRIKSQGSPCERGETSKQTGCVPASGEATGQTNQDNAPEDRTEQNQSETQNPKTMDESERVHLKDEFLQGLSEEARAHFAGSTADHSGYEMFSRLQLSAEARGEHGPLSDYMHNPEIAETYEKVKQAMVEAADHAVPLDHPVTVFFGVKKPTRKLISHLIKTGGEGFLYVSINKEMSAKYAKKKGIVVSVTLPAGTPVAYGWDDQSELIIPPEAAKAVRVNIARALSAPNAAPSPYGKGFTGYRTKDKGGPCEQGETSANTGCIPASGAAAAGSQPEPKKPQRRAGEKPKAVRGQMAEARREGKGKDARIILSSGQPASKHITPAMVPPQWVNVQVSTDPKADVLVTGRDAKGRVKVVYSDKFHMRTAAWKFAKTEEGLRKFAAISAENQKNRASKDPRVREAADATWLMQEQGTRPGGEADTKGFADLYDQSFEVLGEVTTDAKGKQKSTVKLKFADREIPVRDIGAAEQLVTRRDAGEGLEDARYWLQSFGATTLEARHVVEAEDGVYLQFMGKESVWHDHKIRDPKLAEMLLERKRTAEQRGGKLFDTDATRLRNYVSTLDGGKFRSKDMRTMLANRLAIGEISKVPDCCQDDKEYKAAVKAVAEKVSRVLGNDPAMALKAYIDPSAFAQWKANCKGCE